MTKRLCRQIGFGKPLLFWGFSLAFGLSRRTSMCSALSSHILSLLYNQYYFIFAILPILLFFCGSVMEDDPIIFVLRYGSYKHYFTSKWRSLGVLCSGLWLGQITILFVTGAGLSVIKQGWDNFSGSSLLKEIAPLLVKSFPGAWVAVFCAAVYMLMGYWLIALLTLWLGYFLQRQKAIKVLLALYILTILSIKLPIMSRPPFCYLTGINHWVLLLHMVTKVYAHILDEDRKVNAQKFESAFYANPDLRGVQAPAEPAPALDVQSIAAMEAGLKKLETQEQKYSAELDKALDEYAELKAQAADFDPVELYEARQAIRPAQEKAAEQQLEDALQKKPSFSLLLNAKQETSRLLKEDTEERQVRQMLIRRQRSDPQKPKHFQR